jgi:hypothetical protein
MNISVNPIDNRYTKDDCPVKCAPVREWFEEDKKTKNHAKFCLPLLIANSIGFYITSPCDFDIFWDGNLKNDAHVKVHSDKFNGTITTHSAAGSFTIQSYIVPKTQEGWLTMVKQIPNVRSWFNTMEAIIESYWSPANFGLVCLLNQAGAFTIKKGDPIAQMILVHEDSLKSELSLGDSASLLKDRQAFDLARSNYSGLQLNYFRGEWFEDSEKIPFKHYKPNLVSDRNKSVNKDRIII